MKAKSFQLSKSLYGIKDALVDINKDIEDTKRKLEKDEAQAPGQAVTVSL